jgi:hypothetical protein
VTEHSPHDAREDGVEHFVPTGGRVMGILGLVVAAGFVVLWLLDRESIPAAVAAGALVVGVLVWASLLRPRVSASAETLILRNMLETIRVPLAAIDELVVRQVLGVRVGGRKFVSPAVGRKLRKIMKPPSPSALLMPALPERMDDTVGRPAEERPKTDIDYVDHVEARLRQLVYDARARHGVRRYSDEAEALARGVRREPAWPEIVALAATTVLFVVALVV